MRNYSAEFYANLKLCDSFLRPFNQGVLVADNSKGLRWFLNLWPIWYSCLWIALYTYLILVESAGPVIVSQQMLSMFCIVQLAVKQLNGKLQWDLLRRLLKWCEEIYTVKLKPEYQTMVNRVFDETNSTITMCIR